MAALAIDSTAVGGMPISVSRVGMPHAFERCSTNSTPRAAVSSSLLPGATPQASATSAYLCGLAGQLKRITEGSRMAFDSPCEMWNVPPNG